MNTMERLKSETRELHASTERMPLGVSMVEGTMSRTAYATLLSTYARLHGALEEAIAGSTHLAVVAVRTPLLARAALASSDVEALGERLPRAALLEQRVVALEGAIRAADGLRLLGMLYVLEGASLGGVFLAPRLATAMALRDDETRFFRGHGASTMAHWSAFKARMNAAVVASEEATVAVTAARELFSALGAIFEAIDEAVRDELGGRGGRAPLHERPAPTRHDHHA